MHPKDLPLDAARGAERQSPDSAPPSGATSAPRLRSLKSTIRIESAPAGVTIGELLALSADGTTAYVRFDGQPGTAALAARSTVELRGAHVGRSVVLVFERADVTRPVVLGVVRGDEGWPFDRAPPQVDVDADGRRLAVTAEEEIVLRCGKASITLGKDGKVAIEGSYIVSRSSGVNRIKGGSIQLN